MTMLADRLSVGQVPWDYEWRRLVRQLKIPYAVYRKFEWKPRKRRKSPTKKVLQWLVERHGGTTSLSPRLLQSWTRLNAVMLFKS